MSREANCDKARERQNIARCTKAAMPGMNEDYFFCLPDSIPLRERNEKTLIV